MKFTLKDYQRDAIRDSLNNLNKARRLWHRDSDKTAFSLTAVTGAGKTVMAAATFEALFHGDDDFNFDADPGAVVIWFSDDPLLNEQTRFRFIEASDRINYTDLVVVGNTFNRPKFQAGKIYFLNTQKLSKNSLLVRGYDPEEMSAKIDATFPEMRPDLRAYTIWDTIQNTIEDPDLTLYLVLDEAHRGMGLQTAASQNVKSTIVQRLINGVGSVPGIPVVWGISATVERFNKAIESAGKHIKLPNVEVDVSKVQESGLIKDTILLEIPENVGDFDTVLVRRATDKLKESSLAWSAYSRQQQEAHIVVPLMVLQVPNTPDPDEIGRALDIIFERYPELTSSSVAHVFGERTTQRFGNRDVLYIEPQRVEDSTWVRILIAKDAISTGWDCPRAEVMVSFRAASDKTHITQLLGRLVRSPLARRIPGNDRLNAVDCLLPKFNRKAVEQVVDELTSGSEAATPGRVLTDYIEVLPNPVVSSTVWAVFEALPSQTRPQRGAKPAVRLTALAHELASDDILPSAGKIAHSKIHSILDKFQYENEDKINTKRRSVLVVDGKTVKADMLGQGRSLEQFWEDADVAVIDDAYRRAARIFSPSIAHSYVDHLASQVSDRKVDPEAFLEAVIEARVTVASLGLVTEVQPYVDSEAEKLAKDWLSKYNQQINMLSDDRRESYRQIIEMSTEPQDVGLLKPEARYEATKANENGNVKVLPVWDDHLLCGLDGKYPTELNDWERTVVETESGRSGFCYWYRNPQQPGQSSLGIAYEKAGQYGIVRPDFLFFAEQDGSIAVDLVDPHGLYLSDALAKLQGLAQYAASHANVYRRIESIAQIKMNGKLRVLDLKRQEVQDAIATAQDAEALFSSGLADDYQ
ncbi:TPA: DEAD/DEAH box helicase family protein [Citrobacter freundii]|uniref:DEAD/DEAH box helicase family protein n=1 Tax=Citrobacter portucalensis TaxID=1639133 RepID=A0A9X4GL89_9ENTR|nr:MULTISPECIES: DEAD/DEAH box helicase family protein [Citrobacter freundii complex]KAA1148854.1 type III restriction endonuclease subunit R [Citrobacter portucalensis]MBJ9193738.1 DEAD/DEAH box helicase family protein [Citrobacter freundii]MDE9619676.1 DEAD/DEAH box helicase family protein [Citrobacter portucalensis]MDS0975567.1 DEAD/DEAH box helicase family protein [Citrobacter portucalensis]HAT3771180.1 DEAD/DEAH box helicase family protein [Citrobacter freundii]